MEKFVFPTANGIVVHSEGKKVVSFVNCDGQKQLKTYPEKNKIIFWHFPFIRGLQMFFCGMYAQISALILNFDMCEGKKVKNQKRLFLLEAIGFALSLLCGIVFADVFLGFVPSKIAFLCIGESGEEILRNLLMLAFKFAFFFISMLALRLIPVVNEFFRFNRAADVASAENVKPKKQKFPANPLNFLNFLIFAFLFDQIVVTLLGANFGFWLNLLFHISIFLLCIMTSYEILWLLSKTKKLRCIAFATEVFVTACPSVTHIETVIVALSEIGFLTTQKNRGFMEENSHAMAVVMNEVKNKLAAAGINEKSETEWLIATVLGKNRTEVKLVSSVSDKQYQEIMRVATRRAKGESLDNIFGFTEFFGLRFDVNKKVLTPRMETEILVEQVLKVAKKMENAKILDLCTGSGAIAVAVKKNCQSATVCASDISKEALAIAEQNAKKNAVEVEFFHANLFEGLKRRKKYDIIVSNPPYIATEQLPKLDKNVRECDPPLALDGGVDGLDFYRKIIPASIKHLTSGGMLMFEIGKGQGAKVRKMMRDCGFENVRTIKDYAKLERIVCGTNG